MQGPDVPVQILDLGCMLPKSTPHVDRALDNHREPIQLARRLQATLGNVMCHLLEADSGITTSLQSEFVSRTIHSILYKWKMAALICLTRRSDAKCLMKKEAE